MANETITGKIFTLKDPTGTYNRFPRTVMEAVYGLNSYLQNQFSSLADIYMPIEGITESKPLQEFVYRLCPSSIKAKSVSLDRIYGKTLAWNQIVPKNAIPTQTNSNVTFTNNNDGSYTITGDADAVKTSSNFQIDIPAGHKVLMNGSCVQLTKENSENIEANSYTTKAQIVTIPEHTSLWIRLRAGISESINIKTYPFVIDLTLMFGAGHEPSTVAEFEALYPGYHDFGNKLISNDASAIETTGFNKWDEQWQSGSIRSGDGAETSPDGYYRSKDYIRVLPNTTYYIKSPVKMTLFFYDANKNFCGNDYIYWEKKDAEFIVPSVACYVRFRNATANTWTPYSHDICINLSDPAKNGTYEPYRKTTLQLGLNNFKVKDGNGNITTFTEGLKGDGDWADILYSNNHLTNKAKRVNLGDLEWQYAEHITGGSSAKSGFYATLPVDVKRTNNNNKKPNAICAKYALETINALYGGIDKSFSYSSSYQLCIADSAGGTDAATFKAAMDGVYLDYELATSIEYDLVEPLVYSMAAGTTEARISPNADGLSAPFCCDMTYDAQANNDSASAQYALTAGRLLNSHKLWGQDFDGTQDVVGALTGVTSLNSLLYLGSTNVGIGQSNPQYKLDVSGTARFTGAATLGSTLSVAGNTTVGGTLGVTGATTLTGALTANGAVSINNTLTVGTSQTNRATTLNGTLTVTGLTSIAGGVKLTTTKKIWFDDTHYLELLTENGTQYLHTNLNVVSDAGVVAGAATNS